MVIVCLIGGIIGAIIWGVLMSFYLTIEEYKELSHIQSFYIPALTPLAKWIDNKVLMWKIDRERKKTS